MSENNDQHVTSGSAPVEFDEPRGVRGFFVRNWILIKFYSLFGIFMGAFYLGSLHGPTDNFFEVAYPSFLAKIVAAGLNLVGVKTAAYGNQVHMPGFAFTIISGCTAVFAMLIYAAAVLAYPAGIVRKLLGLLMGIPALMTINVVRLVALGVVGVYRRDLFEFSHEYLWQGLFIIIVIAMWMFWRWLLVHEEFDMTPPPAAA